MYKEQEKNNSHQIRHFSEEFKKLKVQELEQKQITIPQIVSLYSVSRAGVYNWIHKYSIHYKKAMRLIVELESESQKKTT